MLMAARPLTADERAVVDRVEAVVVADVRSPGGFADRVSGFLEAVRGASRAPRLSAPAAEAAFAGRRVLVVDDDVRNVFALASALEAHGMEVAYAENGEECLEALRRLDAVDVVLMDVMMPGMDGYRTMEAIRAIPELATLPVIAVTAKAMLGDRERAIASGASDYITKPVDTDQLLALIGIWLVPADGGTRAGDGSVLA